jgi:hypothetical protein
MKWLPWWMWLAMSCIFIIVGVLGTCVARPAMPASIATDDVDYLAFNQRNEPAIAIHNENLPGRVIECAVDWGKECREVVAAIVALGPAKLCIVPDSGAPMVCDKIEVVK